MKNCIHDLIVVEGLDGVGKTTLAKMLAENNSLYYIKIPPEEYIAERILVENAGSSKEKYKFYLDVTGEALKKAPKDKTIVIDRYVYSSIIGYAWNEKITLQDVVEEYKNIVNLYPVPSLIFYIICDNDIRLKRIVNRKKSDVIILDDVSKDFYIMNQECYNIFMSFSLKWVIIDNSYSLKNSLALMNEALRAKNNQING